MTPLDAHCRADAALRACLARMAEASVPDEKQVEYVEAELRYLADRAVDLHGWINRAAEAKASASTT